MYKLYFSDFFYSVPDCQAETEALLLNTQDVYTSNHLVVWATQVLVKEKKIPRTTTIAYKNKEYHLDSDGRFFNPILFVWEDLLDRLL